MSNLAVRCSICLVGVVFPRQALPPRLSPSTLGCSRGLERVPPQAALAQVPQEAPAGGRVFLLAAEHLHHLLPERGAVSQAAAPWPGRPCPGLVLGDTG